MVQRHLSKNAFRNTLTAFGKSSGFHMLHFPNLQILRHLAYLSHVETSQVIINVGLMRNILSFDKVIVSSLIYISNFCFHARYSTEAFCLAFVINIHIVHFDFERMLQKWNRLSFLYQSFHSLECQCGFANFHFLPLQTLVRN